MSTPNNPKRILSVDDDDIVRMLLSATLSENGTIECLESDNMDVHTAVAAIRNKLKDVDVLILDGEFEDKLKTKDQTALQVIQSLAPELSAQRITVIVYSASEEILQAVRATYPSVTTVAKPRNILLIKAAIEARAPFLA